MSAKRIIALIVCIISFLGVAAAPVLTENAVPTVTCVKPEQISYHKQISASGTIEAKEIKEIYLDTPVIAQAVNISVGDAVQKDQVLAEIDSELTKSVLSQSVPSSELLSSIGSIAQGADIAELYKAAQGAGLTGNLGSVEDLVNAYASSEKQKTNEYLYIPSQITAPMDGIITQITLKSDVLSRTSNPLITIADTNQYIALVTVGESFISDIQVGDEAVVKGTGFSGREYKGYVSKIYPTARKQFSGTSQETVVDIEITIEQPDQRLKPGFSSQVDIMTGTQRDILLVPYEAVCQDEDNTEYVYVIKDSKAERRDITVGLELLEGVEVLDGLMEGDLIVEDASMVTKEGTRIHLKRG